MQVGIQRRSSSVIAARERPTRRSSLPFERRQAMYSDIGRKLPVGRVGEADDLAQACIYLMREGYSTGQVIVVDGGAVLV
jgi:NAD(P)-dependent dehydrogenase (short-subunit alcohol dehydrogenase family)